MRFVAAYLMATMGGNPSPSKDDVRAILASVGADVVGDRDANAKLDLLFAQVAGKDVAELIAVGSEKFAFAPCGGAAAAAAAPSAGAAAEEKEKEEEEEEEEEKAVEKVEEEDDDDDIVFSLFDEE
ncbi:60S acidic ribosomal protein P2A-like [Oryza brachyantha]|uniref:60S acidic ribosomal protein P2A-like n=1 Tax=Oryza brachyantha TaxID=4533 RepID=UPI001ADD4053|nr:60S acidic ribosomal protein P2A-like [Oryza brachyantha]